LNEITNAIQEEKETQKNIDTHISNFQKKIIEKKKNCLGISSGAESENSLQKQIKILENRLDKANQKFNETIAVNKDLKLVIDSLRKERVIFDNLYKKLESELHEKRKKMADIIEKANNAYEDRDKANNQINSLKQQAKKEAGEFEKEIKEISHLMEKIKLSTYAKKTKGIEER
jgi:chromosome segregation ATPase